MCTLDKVVATALGHLATAWTAVLVAHHDQQIDVYNFVYSVLKKIAPFLSKLVSKRALTGNAHPNLRGEGGQFPPSCPETAVCIYGILGEISRRKNPETV